MAHGCHCFAHSRLFPFVFCQRVAVAHGRHYSQTLVPSPFARGTGTSKSPYWCGILPPNLPTTANRDRRFAKVLSVLGLGLVLRIRYVCLGTWVKVLLTRLRMQEHTTELQCPGLFVVFFLTPSMSFLLVVAKGFTCRRSVCPRLGCATPSCIADRSISFAVFPWLSTHAFYKGWGCDAALQNLPETA